MENATRAKQFHIGKIAPVCCASEEDLQSIDIHNACFLLLFITEGTATFRVGDKSIHCASPCFVCFDETQEPMLVRKRHMRCCSVYFHPQFLNINMTFDVIRSNSYEDLAHRHDMFLLKPFTDGEHVVPISEPYLDPLKSTFEYMKSELEEQRDWYWSCRARSYFMEMMITLERLYGRIGRGIMTACPEGASEIRNGPVRKAVIFIESNYSDPLTLEQISRTSGMNRTTLNALFKEETGSTLMEYLKNCRIGIARKHLAFTEVPIKEISVRCGFKTVQHFSRVFNEQTGHSPAKYRRRSVEERKRTVFRRDDIR